MDNITRDYYWSLVPEWVIDAAISDRAVRLYAVLGRYADHEGKAFPSRRTLARRLRCSVKSIDRGIAELIEVDALGVEPRYEERDQQTNLYTLRMSPPGDTGDARSRDTGDARPGDTGDAQNESHEEREPVELERARARASGEQTWMVDRKPVKWEHARLAQEILAAWNRAAGQDLRSRDWLAKIVMRIREYPEATLPDHEFIIAANLDAPWWRGAPTPSVIYGNGAQFERAIQTARATRDAGRDDERLQAIVAAAQARRSA